MAYICVIFRLMEDVGVEEGRGFSGCFWGWALEVDLVRYGRA